MALILHSGAAATDLATPGTVRQDISDYLAASLVMQNNVLGMTRVGAEFVDSLCRWAEDRLNADFITDTQGGGLGSQSAGATGTLVVSASDFAIIDIGYILVDISSSLWGATNEHLKVTGKTGSNTIQVLRGFAGSTPSAHAQGAVYGIYARPTYENSDLGPDMSRARIAKYNYVSRQELNVNLSSEAIVRSRRGYTVGVNDELRYQFYQRTCELLRIWNKAELYSKPDPGTGTAGQTAGDYSTFAGIRSWLDGTWNNTATQYNFAAQGLAAGQVDVAINAINKTLFRSGAVDDWCIGGPNIAEDVGRLYNDRIRLQQDEFTRGFAANWFRTTMGNELRMLLDGFVYDTSPAAEIFVVDSGRLRLRPFAEQWFYLISGPSLRDGDAVRALSKMSVEMRNTGSDVGQAHMLAYNVTP